MRRPPRHPRLSWWALRLGPAPILLATGVTCLVKLSDVAAAIAYLSWCLALILYTINSLAAWRAGYWRGNRDLSAIMMRGPSAETHAMLHLHLDRTPNPWDPGPQWPPGQPENPGPEPTP
jgi:hypothetical protein